MRELLSAAAIRQTGYFIAGAVDKLVNKTNSDAQLSEVEEMALVGILSTQLVDWLFVRGRRTQVVNAMSADIKFVRQASLPQVA